MKYFVRIIFIFIMATNCTGCVYEFMTARLYSGEYIDIESPIKAKATVNKINVLKKDSGITLQFSYSDLLNSNISYESDTYKNISKNNCLRINLKKYLVSHYVGNMMYANIKTEDETENYLLRLRNINYDEIKFHVLIKNKRSANKKLFIKTNYDIFSYGSDNIVRKHSDSTYREIYYDQSVINYEFVDICEFGDEIIVANNIPMIYEEFTVKYKYNYSVIRRTLLTPLAFAFDLVSLPILIIIELS